MIINLQKNNLINIIDNNSYYVNSYIVIIILSMKMVVFIIIVIIIDDDDDTESALYSDLRRQSTSSVFCLYVFLSFADSCSLLVPSFFLDLLI